jgi:ABC-type polysaccharide/polyol phosphate transport system ATPase subunit
MAIVREKEIFLEAKNVSITFPIPAHIEAREAQVGGRIRQVGQRKELVAVDDVSFRLEAGDRLGLVGHNGSGKTTLLRILAGILQPSSGTVNYNGRLGNALNTNLGFRPEATGRHNIRLKSLMAGVKSKDVAHIIEDVEDFAELGPFLDMPLHTYSAGMRARLAFGIATAFRYDILILDEWLGAGDKSMQKGAAERMNDYVEGAGIVVLASHNQNILERICNKIICMQKFRQS